jgi:hypothetical protein
MRHRDWQRLHQIETTDLIGYQAYSRFTLHFGISAAQGELDACTRASHMDGFGMRGDPDY